MTIAQDAQKLLKTLYRLHNMGLPAFQMTDSHYGAKLAACKDIASAAALRGRWAVKACNGVQRYDAKAKVWLATWTEADCVKHGKSDYLTETRIHAALVTLFGTDWQNRIVLELQGDPRGAMVKLHETGTDNARVWV